MAYASIQMFSGRDSVSVEARDEGGALFVTFTDSASGRVTISDPDPERLVRLMYDAAREVARVNGLRMQREAEAVA